MRGLATQQILEEQYGRPTYLQTITKAAAGAQLSSAIVKASRLLIQPTVACTIKVGDSTAVADATTCVGLVAGEKFYCCLKTTDTHLSVFFSAAGSVNVFLME